MLYLQLPDCFLPAGLKGCQLLGQGVRISCQASLQTLQLDLPGLHSTSTQQRQLSAPY